MALNMVPAVILGDDGGTATAMASPHNHYFGNWRGSYEGWLLGMESFNLRMSKTLPGLDNFYMVGQWVEPSGGLPPAATSGRNLAQVLCRRDGKRFVTTNP